MVVADLSFTVYGIACIFVVLVVVSSIASSRSVVFSLVVVFSPIDTSSSSDIFLSSTMSFVGQAI